MPLCILLLFGAQFVAPLPFARQSVAQEAADEAQPKDAATPVVSYSRDILPIFRTHCQGCHQPAKPQGAFTMISHADLMSAGESGDIAVVPGEPDQSYLIAQITSVDGSAAMPKNAPPLKEAEVELIRRWIAEGARDDSPAAPPSYDAEHPPVYTRPPVTTALAFSPDGSLLAVSGFQEVLLVDVATQKTVKRLIGLSERIESVSFSPDAKRLAVAGGSPGRLGEIQIWDVDSGSLVLSHQETYDTVYGGCFSPDGKLVAFGAADNVVRAIDAETGEKRLHQGAHEDWVLTCAFNPSGTHLLSAGRDMTVKLTEVATERFVDNVTSITPGALRGGVSAVVSHPERDEILVGGADGVPKIYRIFRQTERRIGDDANLIRQFPSMPGRIFSLSITRDGQYFVAASTLDGVSHVRVYPYEFKGETPENVAAALAKPYDQRNDEEKNLVNGHLARTSDAIVSLDMPAVSLYAVSFTPAGDKIALGGSDGRIRLVDVASSSVLAEFSPVELQNPAENAQNEVQQLAAASGMPLETVAIPDSQQERELLPRDKLLVLSVEPSVIDFHSMDDAIQLVVSAQYAGGQVCDVTRQVSVAGSDQFLEVSPLGLVRPRAAGAGHLEIKFQDAVVQLAFNVNPAQDAVAQRVDFIQDVNPILSRLGCNQGTCHGAQKGKNGFQLSLRGYDPVGDVRALGDDLRARRLNTASPDSSLMLLKPLGMVPHEGGVLMTADSVHYDVLRRWIADGAPLETTSPKVASIAVFPNEPVIERENAWQQFRVVASYPDGSTRDVTQEAFIESGNTEVCKSFTGGRVQALRRGEAPILARYEGAYAAATVTVMGQREGFTWEEPESFSTIDRLVAQKWERMKIIPSELCTDEEFLRRVRLDLTGLPPTADEVRQFLDDPRPSRLKRQTMIDELIGSEDYVQHWTNRWADLLQVNSKFLGSDGAKSFREWIRTAVDENRPYDQFARDVLTASGSNKENPAASYFKILRDPDMMMENTTHLFLAVRFNCNKCHDHPFERWTQDQYYELAAYFARTGLEKDPAGGDATIGGSAVEGAKPLYEIVVDKLDGEIKHERTKQTVAPKLPFDCDYSVAENASRREQLAAWITSHDNPYFARSYVNRLWGYLTGTGLVEPLDDIRAGNPPTNPELLDHLTEEFIRSDFNVEHVLRLICNSRTYQLSVATHQWNADDKQNYSHSTARRLPAEVLYDAVHRVTGAVSAIPGVEPGTRAAALPDVAVQLADGFLNNLGRPVRESACECERSKDLQLGPVMALVSGPTVGQAISDPACMLPQLASNDMSDEDLIREIYLRVLNRRATDEEVQTIAEAARSIETDHQQLTARLQELETWWVGERQRLEDIRLAKLAETRGVIAAREVEIKPERERLEAERLERITAAEAAVKAYAENPVALVNQRLATPPGRIWFPLAAVSAVTSNQATLIPQGDRSIVASGNAEPGIYTVTYRTPLRGIKGVRLEALGQPGIPGSGPGLPANGNFVITEFQAQVAPLAKPDEKQPVLFAAAKADFTQQGFSPEATIDGQTNDQGGWAVHPSGGTVHWATYQLKEPLDIEGGVELTFQIHQFHNAVDHRLACFRISVTTDDGELQLDEPEEFAAVRAIPEDKRTVENISPVFTYLEKNDQKWIDLRAAVAMAQQPVPADGPLTELQSLAQSLEVETADAPQLVRLRADVAASQQQLDNRRLTLAQDLTWALINSPAFLFNH